MKLKDLKFDKQNINKGSLYGNTLLEKSLRQGGAGRSILIDKNNVIIAGNQTVQKASEIGIDDLQIIESDGKRLIAVKRTDIDINSPEGAKMKILDNTVSKHNYIEDAEVMEAICEEYELEEADYGLNGFEKDNGYGTEFSLKDGDKEPFQQMTFTLADEQALIIQNAISEIKQTDEYKYCETTGNENSNGNALYLIVSQWVEQRK